MPGMNSGLNVNDPTVVAAFRSALLHQALIALLIFAVLALAWAALRTWRPGVNADARRMSRKVEVMKTWKVRQIVTGTHTPSITRPSSFTTADSAVSSSPVTCFFQ